METYYIELLKRLCGPDFVVKADQPLPYSEDFRINTRRITPFGESIDDATAEEWDALRR